MKQHEKIPFARPFVPENQELLPYLGRIRESHMLSNGGPLHEELEQELAGFLGVKYVSLFTNGSIALMVALKALDLEGEVITTPFTWIATAQAVHWNNLTPVFADIHICEMNIDPGGVEGLITSRTSAMLPVHVFGNPCDVDTLQSLADKYQLKIVYDAAHAFGVRLHDQSVSNFGNLSVLSFHATKVFNCFEGGAIISHDKSMKEKIDALRNHGFTKDGKLAGYGLNGKMNEMQAACGLIHLKHVDRQIKQRKAATDTYRQLLANTEGIDLFPEKPGIRQNFSYFPVLVDKAVFGGDRDELMGYLENRGITTRAYFSQLVTDFDQFGGYTSASLPNARMVADRILCLPLFHGITNEQIARVVIAIAGFRRKAPGMKKAAAK